MLSRAKHRRASRSRDPDTLYISVTGRAVTFNDWQRFRPGLATLQEAELLALVVTDDIPPRHHPDREWLMDQAMATQAFERLDLLLQQLPEHIRPQRLKDPKLQRYRLLGWALRLSGRLNHAA